MTVAQSLLESGIVEVSGITSENPNIPSFEPPLRLAIESWVRDPKNQICRQMVDLLAAHEAPIDAAVVKAAVSSQGTRVLRHLVHLGADIERLGTPAMVRAAKLNNVEAIKLLHRQGVDTRSRLSNGLTVFHAAAIPFAPVATLKTLELLVELGADPLNPDSNTPVQQSTLLQCILMGSHDPERELKVEYLLELGLQVSTVLPGKTLLETVLAIGWYRDSKFQVEARHRLFDL